MVDKKDDRDGKRTERVDKLADREVDKKYDREGG